MTNDDLIGYNGLLTLRYASTYAKLLLQKYLFLEIFQV